jgi:hypothetical protein
MLMFDGVGVDSTWKSSGREDPVRRDRWWLNVDVV